MREIRLETKDAKLVWYVEIPDSQVDPEIVQWGARFFQATPNRRIWREVTCVMSTTLPGGRRDLLTTGVSDE